MSLTVYSFLQRQNLYFIQAQDQIKNIYITTANRYLFIYFKTVNPIRTRIIFNDATTQQTIEKTISDKPATLHMLTTGDVNIDDEIYYQIVLIDKEGLQTRTELQKLEISK